MDKKVIIVGGFHEIIELVEDCNLEIVGIIDNLLFEKYHNYTILGRDDDVVLIRNNYKSIPLIVSPDKPRVRKNLVEFYTTNGFSFENLVSPKSNISRSSHIGRGSIIQSGVNLSSESEVGEFVKLNSLCNIMHNSLIGDFSTIAPNAVVLGNVKIGKLTYIGSNSTILPGLTIGNEVIIGAGSVVTKDVPDGKTFVGNPAKELKS